MLSSFLSLSLAITLFRRHHVPSATTAGIAMVFATIYSFGHAYEIISQNADQMLFWLHVQYIGTSFLPISGLYFAKQFVRKQNQLPLSLLLYLVIPFLVLLTNLTNAYHSLFYRSVSVDTTGNFPSLVFEQGPMYYVHIFYSIFLVVYSLTILILAMHKDKKRLIHHYLLIIMGLSVPLFALVIIAFGTITKVDIVAFGVAVTSILFYLGIEKFELFNVTPLILDNILADMSDAIMVFDDRYCLVYYNQEAKSIFHIKGSENNNANTLFADFPDIADTLIDAKSRITIQHLKRQRAHDVSVTPIHHKGKLVGYTMMIADVTERRRYHANLQEMANKDWLTRLYNRHYFSKAFQGMLKRKRDNDLALSIIMFDLDHFKLVNDKHGHLSGDRALIQTAILCRSIVRSGDIIARFGGEEFIILMPGANLSHAGKLAERLRKTIETTLFKGDTETFHMTASFGVYGIKEGESNPKEILRKVDKALYQAKETGRNTVFVSE